jgi:uncharacterized surface protein with fasciclin (FAS1) repeats
MKSRPAHLVTWCENDVVQPRTLRAAVALVSRAVIRLQPLRTIWENSDATRITPVVATATAALALSGAVTPASAQMNEKTVQVGGAPMYPKKNIMQNAVNSRDHTTLVKEGEGQAKCKTVAGGDLWVKQAGPGKLSVTDARGRVSMVTIAHVLQSNGVIHVIDTVLLPM